MRRDAQARRTALIEAAAACFAERGYAVPLEDIAERAGVGRGTLYRNFRDRMALALAIFAREIDLLEESIARDAPIPAVLADVIRRGARASNLFARLAAEMPLAGDDGAAFERLGARAAAILEPAAARARADGTLRAEITGAQLLLAMRMVSGLLHPTLSAEDVETRIAQALDLLFAGLAPCAGQPAVTLSSARASSSIE